MRGRTRVSARVVVVDEDEHVLLVRILDALDTKPPFWITPGGSVEGDEALSDAAARELREETGFVVTPDDLGRPIAVARGDWLYRGTPLSAEDWYFGLRARRFAPEPDGYTDLERQVLGTWRWWSLADLEVRPRSSSPRVWTTSSRGSCGVRTPSTARSTARSPSSFPGLCSDRRRLARSSRHR